MNMNYYDEEIVIAEPDKKNLNAVKVNRMPIGSGSSRGVVAIEQKGQGTSETVGRGNNRTRQKRMLESQSSDDDGLLQKIIDDDNDDNDDSEDFNHPKPSTSDLKTRGSATQRPTALMRPTSSRFANLPTAKVIDNDSEHSESESDEDLIATMPVDKINSNVDGRKKGSLFDFEPPPKSRIPSATGEVISKKQASIDESLELDITPDKWENLNIHEEVKDLFPCILKYTPQSIEVPYRLQPFIPEYVPAVGDVEAFLKVTTPPPLDPQREHELNEHLRKLGLYFLDEPAGEQSQPSLLNLKLRSVLTGSGVNPRLASAALIPTAKTPKDIDKWIGEVEQAHMSQSVHDVQPRKDIEPLLMDWPREYAIAAPTIQDAYQRCLQEDITLADYVRILSEHFGIDGRLETQADYILNVQTLFTLYLAANQAWE